jgi:hypothetical protein
MVFRNWRCVFLAIALLGAALGCVHRTGSASPKSTVAARFGQANESASSKDRGAQKGIDEVLKQAKPNPRLRPAPAVSLPTTRAEPRQPIDLAHTYPLAYNIVIQTQQTPTDDTRMAAAPSAAPNSVDSSGRGGGRLRSRAAMLIALALIVVIVWLPRFRHRGDSTRHQGA